MAKIDCALCGVTCKSGDTSVIGPMNPIINGADCGKDGVRVCNTCFNICNTLVHRFYIGMSIDDISEYLKAAEDRIGNTASSNIRENYLQFIKEIKNGYPDFKAFQDDMCRNFSGPGTHVFEKLIAVNENNKTFSLIDNECFRKKCNGSDLLDFDVVEDGDSITSGRGGSAAAGALLAGTMGAVIGASMSKSTHNSIKQFDIILYYKDPGLGHSVLNLLPDCDVSKQSSQYKETLELCKRITTSLTKIIDNSAEKETTENKAAGNNDKISFSVADELLKFKQLLDMGIISQKEFDEQKKKLLSLPYNIK